MLSLAIKKRLSSQRGIALITAILACVILFALAVLVLHLSTSDLRVSSRTVGEKKALNAAEAGIHRFMRDYDPADKAWDPSNPDNIYGDEFDVDTGNDPSSHYTISAPTRPSSKVYFLPLPGYDMTGGKDWGITVYEIAVQGENDNYGTRTNIELGIGYGPVKKDPGLT